jgi:broad specificity phosphatase PhoE
MAGPMSRRLVLIRHSNTQPIPGIAAKSWPLSETGRARCDRLAQQIAGYGVDRVITSEETKAIETGRLIAERLGKPWQSASGLHEHDRSNVTTWHGAAEFQAIIAELFARTHELVYGLETADACYVRFANALNAVLSAYPTETLAIVSHATAMSLFISHVTRIEPFAFWQQLGMPAYVTLDLPKLSLIETINLL